MRIETKELKFTYGANSTIATRALDGVNLLIEEGEFYGIIGKTGSGKSTFIQHINGLLKVQKNSGKITVGEFDLADKKCDFKALRKKVGMVFQYPEYQLFAETVYDDVAFGIKNFMPATKECEISEMVENALTLVGLNYKKIKDKSPFEMSGGQKRRVAIAGVIATRPEVLVLDEPAAGLDPKGKREFIQLLHQLHKDFVKTVIIVSHDMDLISENCTRVAVFDSGKIVTDGTPKQIFSFGEVLKAGLSLPVTQSLTQKLKGAGINLDSDLTIADFTDKVLKALGGKL